MKNQVYHLAAYYFPNFHVDVQNEKRHGKGWTEWNVLRHAVPRFEGHVQPKVPEWGYEDEADPEVMSGKIKAASENGVDTFIFDWYYYDNGPFLNRCLDEGFLGSNNVNDMNFAIMWANHDWCNMHPKGLITPIEMYQSGKIGIDTFWDAVQVMIQRYFSHPSYLRIDGKLYLSFYELSGLLRVFGGVKEAKEGLDELRRRVRRAGLGELHINTMVWSYKVLPEEQLVPDMDRIIHELGFDSVTSYVWAHMAEMKEFPIMDYAAFRDRCLEETKVIASRYSIPYFPNVTVGWDPSARTTPSDQYEDVGYPFTPILTANTPDEFEVALRKTKEYLDVTPIPKLITVNAWNEWTEGSYLEPDSQYHDGFLKAVKKVFVDEIR